ncbi:DUF1445 domain protein [Fusarium sp. NRRL 52700]|nr:DUF1445 domain protein [Fusarium sp. NRRL 52700]
MTKITSSSPCSAASGDALMISLNDMTGAEARLAARSSNLDKSTSGVASGYVQANLIILPSRYANDFRNLCARNPVPCPLIAESRTPGDFTNLKSYLPRVDDTKLASDLDLRTDCPHFNVYSNSKLAHSAISDLKQYWSDDHVAFMIGCSQSFESAIMNQGLPVRHILHGRTVPMYRTNTALNPSGVFSGSTYVVSMRTFKKRDIGKVRDITRPFSVTHGEPVAWGWDAVKQLGIADIDKVQWGQPPLTEDFRPLSEVFGDDDNVPVFWGCGVTPQEAVMKASLQGIIMAHYPGEMLIMDCKEEDII